MKQILAFLFLGFSFLTFSQSYLFKNFSVADGLSQTQVTSIVEDNNGYLWIGTLGGLSRFNGSKFTNFSSEDGLLNNRITSLFCHNDSLWIGHESGISLYYKDKFQTWNFNKSNVNVSDIIYFNNKLVFSTIGEGLFVLRQGKLQQIKLPQQDENVIRKLKIIDNKLYLATRLGLFETKDLKKIDKIDLKEELNVTAIETMRKDIILSSIDGRIFLYNIKKNKKEELFSYQALTFTKQILINKKQIWLTNLRGLTSINSNKNEVINEDNGLTFSSLNCIYIDKNGTYWIGSDGKGLYRFAGTEVKYFNKNNGLQSDLITAIKRVNGSMIFGSYDNGLIYEENGRFKVKNLPNNTVWGIEYDWLNNTWVGTQNGLFKVSSKKTESFATDYKINCFYKENKNKIWVGGSNGLNKIINGTYTEDLTQDFNLGTIRSIVRFNGDIYCATDEGLHSFKNGKFLLISGFKKRISSLVVDGKNQLWIGTEEGLFLYDGKEIIMYRLDKEPSSKFINFLAYNNKNLYVGTNNGLYILNTQNQQTTIHYGMDEGIVNLETNINSSFFDEKGNFWFGTAEGLVYIDLNKNEINNNPTPFLNITAIKVNYQALDEKYITSTKNGVQSIKLPYNKNNIIIELDGVLLKKHNTLYYEYWLEGFDEKWSPSFSNTILNLSNLQSGKYTLHIRAKNKNGLSSKEYLLHIKIEPVFYKSWWFITLAILLGLLIIYAIFKYRINREKRERDKETLELKAKLLILEQQTLNASMNRHFIFNSLNSIQYFINTQDKFSANKFLSNFAKLIRKNLDSSAEDGGLVTLQEEIERLQLYLSLEEMRFKDKFDFEIKADPSIDLESIKIPSMLMQPFVENSIIHGVLPLVDKKGKILVDISITNNELLIKIEDNGVGITKSLAQKGLISGDHKSKGMEITNKRIGILNKFNNQGYLIEGPIELKENNRLIKGTVVLIKIMLKNLEIND
jgi:ligand-binding sensor domain-containing protein